MEEKKTLWERIHDILFPDRTEERKHAIRDAYSVILKEGDLFLVYNNEIVIRKILKSNQNLDTVTIIEDTIKSQMQFEELK